MDNKMTKSIESKKKQAKMEEKSQVEDGKATAWAVGSEEKPTVANQRDMIFGQGFQGQEAINGDGEDVRDDPRVMNDGKLEGGPKRVEKEPLKTSGAKNNQNAEMPPRSGRKATKTPEKDVNAKGNANGRRSPIGEGLKVIGAKRSGRDGSILSRTPSPALSPRRTRSNSREAKTSESEGEKEKTGVISSQKTHKKTDERTPADKAVQRQDKKVESVAREAWRGTGKSPVRSQVKKAVGEKGKMPEKPVKGGEVRSPTTGAEKSVIDSAKIVVSAEEGTAGPEAKARLQEIVSEKLAAGTRRWEKNFSTQKRSGENSDTGSDSDNSERGPRESEDEEEREDVAMDVVGEDSAEHGDGVAEESLIKTTPTPPDVLIASVDVPNMPKEEAEERDAEDRQHDAPRQESAQPVPDSVPVGDQAAATAMDTEQAQDAEETARGAPGEDSQDSVDGSKKLEEVADENEAMDHHETEKQDPVQGEALGGITAGITESAETTAEMGAGETQQAAAHAQRGDHASVPEAGDSGGGAKDGTLPSAAVHVEDGPKASVTGVVDDISQGCDARASELEDNEDSGEDRDHGEHVGSFVKDRDGSRSVKFKTPTGKTAEKIESRASPDSLELSTEDDSVDQIRQRTEFRRQEELTKNPGLTNIGMKNGQDNDVHSSMEWDDLGSGDMFTDELDLLIEGEVMMLEEAGVQADDSVETDTREVTVDSAQGETAEDKAVGSAVRGYFIKETGSEEGSLRDTNNSPSNSLLNANMDEIQGDDWSDLMKDIEAGSVSSASSSSSESANDEKTPVMTEEEIKNRAATLDLGMTYVFLLARRRIAMTENESQVAWQAERLARNMKQVLVQEAEDTRREQDSGVRDVILAKFIEQEATAAKAFLRSTQKLEVWSRKRASDMIAQTKFMIKKNIKEYGAEFELVWNEVDKWRAAWRAKRRKNREQEANAEIEEGWEQEEKTKTLTTKNKHKNKKKQQGGAVSEDETAGETAERTAGTAGGATSTKVSLGEENGFEESQFDFDGYDIFPTEQEMATSGEDMNMQNGEDGSVAANGLGAEIMNEIMEVQDIIDVVDELQRSEEEKKEAENNPAIAEAMGYVWDRASAAGSNTEEAVEVEPAIRAPRPLGTYDFTVKEHENRVSNDEWTGDVVELLWPDELALQRETRGDTMPTRGEQRLMYSFMKEVNTSGDDHTDREQEAMNKMEELYLSWADMESKMTRQEFIDSLDDAISRWFVMLRHYDRLRNTMIITKRVRGPQELQRCYGKWDGEFRATYEGMKRCILPWARQLPAIEWSEELRELQETNKEDEPPTHSQQMITVSLLADAYPDLDVDEVKTAVLEQIAGAVDNYHTALESTATPAARFQVEKEFAWKWMRAMLQMLEFRALSKRSRQEAAEILIGYLRDEINAEDTWDTMTRLEEAQSVDGESEEHGPEFGIRAEDLVDGEHVDRPVGAAGEKQDEAAAEQGAGIGAEAVAMDLDQGHEQPAVRLERPRPGADGTRSPRAPVEAPQWIAECEEPIVIEWSRAVVEERQRRGMQPPLAAHEQLHLWAVFADIKTEATGRSDVTGLRRHRSKYDRDQYIGGIVGDLISFWGRVREAFKYNNNQWHEYMGMVSDNFEEAFREVSVYYPLYKERDNWEAYFDLVGSERSALMTLLGIDKIRDGEKDLWKERPGRTLHVSDQVRMTCWDIGLREEINAEDVELIDLRMTDSGETHVLPVEWVQMTLDEDHREQSQKLAAAAKRDGAYIYGDLVGESANVLALKFDKDKRLRGFMGKEKRPPAQKPGLLFKNFKGEPRRAVGKISGSGLSAARSSPRAAHRAPATLSSRGASMNRGALPPVQLYSMRNVALPYENITSSSNSDGPPVQVPNMGSDSADVYWRESSTGHEHYGVNAVKARTRDFNLLVNFNLDGLRETVGDMAGVEASRIRLSSVTWENGRWVCDNMQPFAGNPKTELRRIAGRDDNLRMLRVDKPMYVFLDEDDEVKAWRERMKEKERELLKRPRDDGERGRRSDDDESDEDRDNRGRRDGSSSVDSRNRVSNRNFALQSNSDNSDSRDRTGATKRSAQGSQRGIAEDPVTDALLRDAREATRAATGTGTPEAKAGVGGAAASAATPESSESSAAEDNQDGEDCSDGINDLLRVPDEDGGFERAMQLSLSEAEEWVESPGRSVSKCGVSEKKQDKVRGERSLSNSSSSVATSKVVTSGGSVIHEPRTASTVGSAGQIRLVVLSNNKKERRCIDFVSGDEGDIQRKISALHSGSPKSKKMLRKGEEKVGGKIRLAPASPVKSIDGTGSNQRHIDEFANKKGFEQFKNKDHNQDKTRDIGTKMGKTTNRYLVLSEEDQWEEIEESSLNNVRERREIKEKDRESEAEESVDSMSSNERKEFEKKVKKEKTDREKQATNARNKTNSETPKKTGQKKYPLSDRSVGSKRKSLSAGGNGDGSGNSSSSDSDSNSSDEDSEKERQRRREKAEADEAEQDLNRVKKITYKWMIKEMRRVMQDARGLGLKFTPAMRKNYIRILNEEEEGEMVPSTDVINVHEEMLAGVMKVFRGNGNEGLDPEGYGVKWRSVDHELALRGKRFLYTGRIVSAEYVKNMQPEDRKKVMSVLRGTRFIDASGTIPSGEYEGMSHTPAMINSYRWEEEPGHEPKNNIKIVAPNVNDIAEIEVVRHTVGEELAIQYGYGYDWSHTKIEAVKAVIQDVQMVLTDDLWKTKRRTTLFNEVEKRIEDLTPERYTEIAKLKYKNIEDKPTREMRAIIALVEGQYEDIFAEEAVDGVHVNDIHFPHHLYRLTAFRRKYEFKTYMKPVKRGKKSTVLTQEDLLYTLHLVARTSVFKNKIEKRPDMAMSSSQIEPAEESEQENNSKTGPSEDELAVSWAEEECIEAIEKYVQTKGREPITSKAIRTVENMNLRLLKVLQNNEMATPQWLQDVAMTMDMMYRMRHKRVEKNRLAIERGNHSDTDRSASGRRKGKEHRKRRAEDDSEDDEDKSSESEPDKEAIAERKAETESLRGALDKGSARAREAVAESVKGGTRDLHMAGVRVSDNSVRGSVKSHRSKKSKKAEDEEVSELSDTSTINEDGKREKRKRESSGGLGEKSKKKRGDETEWSNRAIAEGFEYLYRDPIDLKKGLGQHRWPHVLIGRTQVELNRMIPRIPNFDYEELRIHKKTSYLFSEEDFVKRGGTIFNNGGVFDWVKTILKMMEDYNIHPNTMAHGIWKGMFMSKERRMEIEDEKTSCQMGNTTDRIAFEEVVNKKHVERSYLWLEALLIWMMKRYGRGDILLDAAQEIAKLRLMTRSLVGVYKLHNKIRMLQKQLPSDQRSYAVFDKFFQNALEKNPHIDPTQLVHDFNMKKQLAEFRMRKAYTLEEFEAKTDEEKFEHIRAVVKDMHEYALAAREDAKEYTSAGRPMDNTEAKAQTEYEERQRQLNSKTNAVTDSRKDAARHNRREEHTRIHSYDVTDKMYGFRDEDREDVEKAEQLLLFTMKFEPMYHNTDKSKKTGTVINCQVLMDQMIEQKMSHVEIKQALVEKLSDAQKTSCTCCGFTGHERVNCTVCVNDEISKDVLSKYDKERADRRMFSAWSRGGDLSGKSQAAYKAFQKEVDEMREKRLRTQRGLPEQQQMVEDRSNKWRGGRPQYNKFQEKRDMTKYTNPRGNEKQIPQDKQIANKMELATDTKQQEKKTGEDITHHTIRLEQGGRQQKWEKHLQDQKMRREEQQVVVDEEIRAAGSKEAWDKIQSDKIKLWRQHSDKSWVEMSAIEEAHRQAALESQSRGAHVEAMKMDVVEEEHLAEDSDSDAMEEEEYQQADTTKESEDSYSDDETPSKKLARRTDSYSTDMNIAETKHKPYSEAFISGDSSDGESQRVKQARSEHQDKENKTIRRLRRDLQQARARAAEFEEQQLLADKMLAQQMDAQDREVVERRTDVEEHEMDWRVRKIREPNQKTEAERFLEEEKRRVEAPKAFETKGTLEYVEEQIENLLRVLEWAEVESDEWYTANEMLDMYYMEKSEIETASRESETIAKVTERQQLIAEVAELFPEWNEVDWQRAKTGREPDCYALAKITEPMEICKHIAYFARRMEATTEFREEWIAALSAAMGQLDNIDDWALREQDKLLERVDKQDRAEVKRLMEQHENRPSKSKEAWAKFMTKMRRDIAEETGEESAEQIKRWNKQTGFNEYATEWLREVKETAEATEGTYQHTMAMIEMLENQLKTIDQDSHEWEAANWKLTELRMKLDESSDEDDEVYMERQRKVMQAADEKCWARERQRRAEQQRKQQAREEADDSSGESSIGSAYEDPDTKRMMDRADGLSSKRTPSGMRVKTRRSKGTKGILCNLARWDKEYVGKRNSKNLSEKTPGIYKERLTHNVGLTYMRFKVTKPTEQDELMGYERSERSGKHEKEATASDSTTINIQFDGGAGWSVVSQEFAEINGLRFLEKENPIGVVGFDGSVIKVRYYTVIALEIEGKNTKGEHEKRRFVTQALITPGLHVDFILGSNVAMQHNIIVIPDRNQAELFRGEEKLTVPCLSWDKLASNMKKKPAPSVSIKAIKAKNLDEIEQEEVEELREIVKELVKQRGRVTDVYEIKGIETKIIRRVIENAKLFFGMCKEPFDRTAVAALVITARYFDVAQIRDRVNRLMAMMFDGKERHVISEREFSEQMEDPEVRFAVACVQLVTETQVYVHPRAEMLNIASMTTGEIDEVFETNQRKEQEELEKSKVAVATYQEKYCTQEMIGLKPEEFPEELWKWVADEEKPKVKARFNIFNENTKRKAEVIKTVLGLDVSMETEARRYESKLFIAQALANIDRFEHPDEYNQPRVKDREFVIELLDKTPSMARYQKFNPYETRFLHLKIQGMVLQKRLERSKSPWNSRLSLVPYTDRIRKFVEKHGDNVIKALNDPANTEEVLTFFRLTTDLRSLNEKTKAMCYPLPNIAKIIDDCKGSDRYSTMDIRDAFFTVSMEQQSREGTAFSTPDGHFHYCVMPQGAKNAATYWAEMIADVFREMLEMKKPVIVYQDDIGNYAKELILHLETQQSVYNTLRGSDMVLKASKVHFNYMTQRILGHVLNGEGRRVDPKTIEAVTKLQKPKTVSDVRTIIGLFQYAREYIENLSEIMGPIQELVRKNVDVEKEWLDEVHGVAFEALKIALTTAPILLIPDVSKPFRVQVDACRVGRGIGAILLQKDEQTDQWRPCAYWSRALTKSERRYSATELECSALHDTILHWKSYLRNGHKFEVIVDHYALVYMVTKMGTEQQNQRLLRLCLDLQGFDFTVTHQAGTMHLGADAVSRLLQTDEMPWVRDEDELRDDWGPLSEEEKGALERKFHKEGKFVIDTINEHREKRRREDEEERRQILEELEQKKREHGQKPVIEASDVNKTSDRHSSLEIVGDWEERDEVLMCGDCDKEVTVERASQSNTTLEDRELEKQMEGEVRQFRMVCKSRTCSDWRDQGTCYVKKPKLETSWREQAGLDKKREEQSKKDKAWNRKVERFWRLWDDNWQYNHTYAEVDERNKRMQRGTWTEEDEWKYNDPYLPYKNKEKEVRKGTWTEEKEEDMLGRIWYVKHDPDKVTEEDINILDEVGDELKRRAERKERKIPKGLDGKLQTEKGQVKKGQPPTRSYPSERKAAVLDRKAKNERKPAPTPDRGHAKLATTVRKKVRYGKDQVHEIRPNENELKTSQETAQRDWRTEKGPVDTEWIDKPRRIKYEQWDQPHRNRVTEKRLDENERPDTSQCRLLRACTSTDIQRNIREVREAHEQKRGFPMDVLKAIDDYKALAGPRQSGFIDEETMRELKCAQQVEDRREMCRAERVREKLWELESEQAKLEDEYKRIQLRGVARVEEEVWQIIKKQQNCIDSYLRDQQWFTNGSRRRLHTHTPTEKGEFGLPRLLPYQRFTTSDKTWRDAKEEIDRKWYTKLVKESIDYKIKGLAEMKTTSLETALLSDAIADKVKELIRAECNKRAAQQSVIKNMSTERLGAALRRDRTQEKDPRGAEKEIAKIEKELIERALRRDYEQAKRAARVGQRMDDIVKFNRRYVEEFRAGPLTAIEYRRVLRQIETAAAERSRVAHQRNTASRDDYNSVACPINTIRIHSLATTSATSDAKLPLDVQKKIAKLNKEVNEEQAEIESVRRYVADQTKRTESWVSQLESHMKKIEALRKKQEEWRVKGRKANYRNEEAAQEAQEVVLKRLLKEYNFILGQHYVDPETRQLYQVYDVKMITVRGEKRYVSTAMPICNDMSDAEKLPRQVRTVHGEQGTADLVNLYKKSKGEFSDVELPTTEEGWLAAQNEDQDLKEMIDKLLATANGIIPLDNKSAEESTDYYYLPLMGEGERGALRRRMSKKRENVNNDVRVQVTQSFSQIIVPKKYQRQVLWVMHDAMGHPGRNRTTETTKLKFYWNSMHRDVKEYVANCGYCQQRKVNNRVAKVPVMIYNYSERPNSRVHMDLAGPFELQNRGNDHYIMVIKCALTKWVTMVPLRNKSMLTVQREYLNTWVGHFGAPSILITDRGTEFHNQVADEIARIWDCRKVQTTAKNPRSDGLAENAVKTMKDMLTSYIEENQKDWDEYVHLVAQAYNNTVNDATGFTLYFLVHGTEMTMPNEDYLEKLYVKDFQEITRRTKDVMQWCWSYAGREVVKNSEKANRRPVERLVFKPYQKYDFFYMRVVPKTTHVSKEDEENTKISSKLQYRYTGPFMVQAVLSPILYKAMVHGEVKVVHALNMKPAAKDHNSMRLDRVEDDVR